MRYLARTTTRKLAAGDVAGWLAEWQRLGVRRVFSGGEALLHSHLWELCDLLRAADIGITILSTGLLLRRQAADWRSAATMLSSASTARARYIITFAIFRAPTRSWPRVWRRSKPRIAVAVSARCTVKRQLWPFARHVAAASDLGLDQIGFLAADVSSEAFNRPGGWDDPRDECGAGA